MIHGKQAARRRSMTARSRRNSLRLAILGWVAGGAGNAFAQAPTLPTGAEIVAGQAAISQAAGVMDVNATSSRTIVNWDSFNVGAGNVANFNLPDSSSAILNRVTTPDMPSTIAGAIHSNGNVMLVNPSGIMVDSSGMVNTNGFVASTFDVTNESFLSGGPLTFTNNGSEASVVNEGTIQTGGGGAHLIANEIANHGTIASDGGNITMSGGGTVTLENGVSFVQASMETLVSGISPAAGLIQNTGTIRATGAASVGGEVYLVNPGGEILHDGTIESHLAEGSQGGKVQLEADQITLQEDSLINATGTNGGGKVFVGGQWQGAGEMSQATSVTMESTATIDASATKSGDGGVIVLWSDVLNKESVTRAFGTLIARAGQLSGNGGRIETSGSQVDTTGVRVDAGAPNGEGGDWLIDPYNFIIDLAASITLVGALDSGTNVTVDTTVDLPLLGGLGSDLELGDITLTSDLITGAMSGDATLSLKAHQNIVLDAGVTIDATQNANANKLNVVLWADQDNSGTGTVRIGNAVLGTTIRTNGGGLAITGGSETTWTPSDGDPTIAIGSGRAMAGDLLGLLHGAEILNTDIDTDGGNVLIRAGSTGSLSIFDEVFGIELNGTSISTGSGSITLDGLVGDQTGLNVDNAVGVHLAGGSSLTSSTGDISITGELANTSEFVNGSGVWIGREIDNALTASGNVSITTGDGDIDIVGIGADNSGSGWRHGLALVTSNGSDEINIATVGGNITLDGTANFRDAATSDTSGLQLQPGSAGALLITSQTGDITLRGVNSQEVATAENAIRFTADNVAGDITIGYDGINPYSGDILIQANSISQHFTNAGSGSISIQGFGGLTIESLSDSFSKALVFDDDWNFGASFGSMVFGKINNTANLTFDDPITLAGGFSAMGGELTLNDDLTSTSTGNLLFKSNLATNSSIRLLGNIFKTGGDRSVLTAQADGRVQLVGDITASGSALLDTILWSDYHNTGSGGTSIFGNITTGGGHFWAGGSATDAGSQDWNGLTVGDGGSIGASGFNHNAFDLYGDVDSGGGDILLWAGLGYNTGFDGIGLSGTRLLQSGSGDITLIGDDFGGGTLNVDLYGHLRICPNDIWANIGTQLDFDGSVSANTFTGVNADVNWLVISNLNLLGGLSLGKAGLSQDIRLYDSLTIAGDLELFGRNITVDAGAAMDLSSAGALGNLLVDASGDVNINDAITLGGDLSITGGNDVNLGGLITRLGSASTDMILKADRHVVVNGNIDTLAGSQNVRLWADADNSGDGINIFRANSLATAGGNITTGNGNIAELNGVDVQVGGDIYITNAAAQMFDSDGGNISIQGETIIANASIEGVTFESNGGNIDFSGLLNSGNQYDFIDGPDGAGSWDWARTDARNGTAGGSLLGDSYLVTITSRLENAIAGIEAGYQGAWIGAYRDTATPLDWKWADGPESGQHFWTEVDAGGGAAEPGEFANFGPGEPNGGPSGAGESVGQFYGNSGLWNDLSSSTTFAATQTGDYDVLGYVRETNAAPATVTIDAGATGLVTMGGIGSGKALASLDVTSAGVTVSGDSLITTGAQTYDSGLVVASQVDLNVSSSGLTVDGDIHLEGTALTLASDLTANLSGDILLRTDTLSLPATVAVDTSGELIIEPLNNSFAAPFNLPLDTLTLSTDLTGLVVGKEGNTADLALDGDLNVNGDVSLIGGDATLLGDVNTNGGDLFVRTTGSVVQSANVDVTTDGGSVTYWSDSDADGVGHIEIQSGATVSTEGGDVLFAGGLDTDSDDSPDGFASGQAFVDDSGRFHSGISLHNAVVDARVSDNLDATAGNITLRGTSTYAGGDNASGVLLFGSNLFADQIDVSGSVTDTSGSASRFGILANGGSTPNNTNLQAFGGISLTGTAATAADQYAILWGADHSISVLDGDISIDATGQLHYLSNQSLSLATDHSLIVDTAQSAIWQSIIAGDGGVTKQGTGTLSLQATNTFAGALQIAEGTVSQNQSGAIHNSVAVTVESGAAWDLAGFDETVTSFAGAGSIDLDAGTLTAFGDNSAGSFAGVISGSGNLVKQGSGELVLSGINTYTGTTTVDGSLRLRTDQLSLSSSSYVGTGTLFLEPLNASFASALDTTGTTFGGALAGLTIGKVSNAADITIGSDVSIQGDISLFGGDLNLHAGINSNGNLVHLNGTGDVTQNISGSVVSDQLRLSGGGDFELSSLTNNVATIAATGVGDVHYADSNAIEIGSVGVNGISTSGTITIETLAGDLTVSQNIATTDATASAITLNAGRETDAGTSTGGNIVLADSAALALGDGGRVTLMTGSIEDSTGVTSLVGAGRGGFRYNSDEVASNFSTPLAAGLQVIYREQPTANIVANDVSVTYGNDAPTPNGSATGLVNGDSIGSFSIVAPVLSNAGKLRAGDYDVTDTSLADLGYNVVDDVDAVAVTQKVVTAGGFAASTKVYDGTTNSTLTASGTLVGIETGDLVSIGNTGATFGDKNVGTNKTVTVNGLNLSGSDASNYSLGAVSSASTTGDITAKAISVSGIATSDKVYDGTTVATTPLVGAVFNGMVAGDELSVSSITGTFENKNVGTAKTVSLSSAVYGGADVGNYVISDQLTSSATITARSLTISGIDAGDKVYDGTTSAVVDLSGISFAGLVSGDEINASGTTGTFANKNAGANKSVTLAGTTYGGSDVGNYAITDQASTSADITAKSITVSGLAVDAKVYDGTTSATVDLSGLTFNGLVGGDDVSASGTVGTFADKNVGTAKSVALTGTTYGGTDLANYSISDQTAATGDITAKSVSVSGIVAGDKVYDGTTNATLDTSGISFTGLVNGDDLSIASVTGAFVNRNAATNKTVNLSGSSYSGDDVANYAITDQATALATIGQKAVTVSGITAGDKVYDGSTAAVVDLTGISFVGLLSGDTINASGTTGTFDDNNVGVSKSVTLAGTMFGGSDVGNYAITDQSSTVADITAKSITVSGITVGDKVYDGTTSATVDLSGLTFNGLVAGDDLAGANTVGTFADKNAGIGKSVTLSGTTYGGADLANYSIANQTSTTADITPKSASVTGIVANDKVYDGTNVAAIDLQSASIVGLVTGDDVSVTGTLGTFVDKNVGTDKVVSLSATSYEGTDASNYSFTDQSSTLADVTPLSASVSGLASAGKVYDGNTAAAIDVSGASFTGMISGDELNVLSATGTFDDKHVGSAKQVSIAGANYGGADVGNYNFVDQASTTADITPLAISVSGLTAADKVYDGTTTAVIDTSGVSFDGAVAGDDLNANGTIGTFVNKHVGNSKSVTLSGTVYGGTDVENYVISDQVNATASITPLSVSITGLTGSDKAYDATTLATLNGSATVDTLAGDDVTLDGTVIGNYATKNAGVGLEIGVSGLHLRGVDSNNYTLQSPTGLTGDITPAPLVVTANHDAKFIGKSDSSNYAGVNITGFVGGETALDLGGSLTVSRTGVGVNEAAGEYFGVLSPGGYSSSNYEITFNTGDFTIVPAEELLVRFGNSESVYGEANDFSFLSAQYMDSGNVVHDLADPTQNGSTYTFNDGVGGTAELTIAAEAASYGGGGSLTVGSYDLIASSVSETSANFSNQISVLGNHSVLAAPVSATLSNAAKVYDGTVAFDLSGMSLSGSVAGDSLSLSGVGEYLTKNAGTGLSYTIDGMTLSGDDAGNYFLTSGSSLSGTDGSITAKNVALIAPAGTKIYDGNTSLSATQEQLAVLSGQLGVDGDFVDAITLEFDNKNVGAGKTLTPSNATVLDGNGGANYSISYDANAGATIERLDSVQWVGGSTGDWSDPNNWAGGAIPDLANVANVFLPAGVTPSFDNTVDGPVEIESINGDNLIVQSGTLRIENDASLDLLNQTGGTLQFDGGLGVAVLNQQSGTLDLAGTLSVLQEFTQALGGVIEAIGNIEITQSSGTLDVRNLSGTHVELNATNGDVQVGDIIALGGLNIDANSGNIDQLPGTVTIVNGESSFEANGAVTMNNASNDFRDNVSVNAFSATLRDDDGGLELADIHTVGDFVANSNGGAISQASGGSIAIAGSADFSAKSAGSAADILLDNEDNDFQGVLHAEGRDVRFQDNADELTLGQILAEGLLNVMTKGGAILQDPISTIESSGVASFNARKAGTPADVRLSNANNQFRNVVNVDGQNIEINDVDGQVDFGRYRSGSQSNILRGSLSQNVRDTHTRYIDETAEQTTKSTLGRVWIGIREFVNRVFADAEVPGGQGRPLTIREVTQTGDEIYVHQGREEPIDLGRSGEN